MEESLKDVRQYYVAESSLNDAFIEKEEDGILSRMCKDEIPINPCRNTNTNRNNIIKDKAITAYNSYGFITVYAFSNSRLLN